MNNAVKFAARQDARKRQAQPAALINADLVGRRNQRAEIQRWAEKRQAEG